MAASGFNSILLYGSTTASATPSAANLTTGASGVELAINATDGKLFYKDNLGAVQTLATKSSVISPLTANGVVYVNGSSQATSDSTLTYDGSTFVSTGAQGFQSIVGGNVARVLASAVATYFGSTTAAAVVFQYNSTEKMRLTATGLGISKSSPAYPLDVNGSANLDTGYLYLSNGYGALWGTSSVYGYTNGAVVIRTNGTDRLTADASGNLGLGVTPSAWATYPALQVSKGSLWGPGSSFYLSANLYYDGTNRRYINSAYASEYEQASGQHIWLTAASGTAGAIVSLTQAMTLDASGNLGIGTTSPGAKLQVNGSGVNVAKLVDTSATGYSGLTFAGTGTQNYAIGMGGPSETAFSVANKFFLYDGLAGAMRMVVDSSGNVGIGSNAPTYKLVVSNAGAAGVEINPTGGISGGAFLQCYNRSTAARIPFNTIASEMYWQIDNYEKMRLDTSGNLLLGTTSVVENGIAIFAGAKTFTSGIPQYQLQAQDTTAMAAGVGGAINFTGKYTSGGAITSFASIEASKDNATSGNFGAAMVFKTRVNGGSQTEAMRIDSSQNVGIGTTTPGAKLDVRSVAGIQYWTTTAARGTGNNYQSWYDPTGRKGYMGYGATTSDTFFIANEMNDQMLLQTNATTRISIAGAGNVTINAPSSGTALTVNGTVSATGQVNAQAFESTSTPGSYASSGGASLSYNGSGVAVLRAYSNSAGTGTGQINFNIAGTQAMTLDSSGRLGIGTTSPQQPFVVSNGGANGIEIVPSSGIIQAFNRSSVSYSTLYYAAATHAFRIGTTDYMTLTGSGNLLVGTATTFSGSNLTVQGNSTYAATVLGTAGNTTSNALFIGLGGNRSTDGTYSVINYVDTDGTGTARFRVYGNGNVVNTNNSYGAISDFKLKENVTDATPKLEDLCKVRIVNYNLISDEVKEKRIGVIAQELETVFPSLVDNNPDLDVDGNFTGTSTKSVKYSAFVPMLIKAMQEQQAMIEELKARIVTLENK